MAKVKKTEEEKVELKEERKEERKQPVAAVSPKIEAVDATTARLLCGTCDGNVTLNHMTARDGCFEIDTDCKKCGAGLLRLIKGDGQTLLAWLA
jgi:hypothetical protein